MQNKTSLLESQSDKMVGLTEWMSWFRTYATVLKRIWSDAERRRVIARLIFGGATGALVAATLQVTFTGLCSTPWEVVRLVGSLVAVVGSTIFGFVARGCKPKFKNWTLGFEILCAVIRECVRSPRGERMVMVAKHARAIRAHSAIFGTALGWFTCRQHSRRIEAVHTNDLEHIWLRPAILQTTATRFVVLYVHGGGCVLMSPRLYISFGVVLAVAIEKELRQQLGTKDPVQIDIFLANYRKAPEHCFPTPPKDTVTAYRYLLHTEGISPEQIILAGDSGGGGGLVMSTLLRMRDVSKEHLPLAAIIICPTVDLSEIETHGDPEISSAHCLLSPSMIAAGRLVYHTTAADPTTWLDASSVHCDLRGLPPVFVQTASLDYIYQHSVRLAQKAKDDGVTNWELDVHEDMPHDFVIFPSYVLPYAQIGMQRLAAFAAKHFAKALSDIPVATRDGLTANMA